MRHRHSRLIGAAENVSLSDSFRAEANKRRTMPANLDLSESMWGRRVLPGDLSTVKVQSSSKAMKMKSKRAKGRAEEDAAADGPAGGGSVKDKVSLFEEINLMPVVTASNGKSARKQQQQQQQSRAQKYIPDSDEDRIVTNPVIDMVQNQTARRNQALSTSQGSGNKAASDSEDTETKDDDQSSTDEEELDVSCWSRTKRLFNFLLERREYRDPHTFGWRIKFRRLFLTIGVVLFTYLTIFTTLSTQNFSSKQEIQRMLDYGGKCQDLNASCPSQ